MLRITAAGIGPSNPWQELLKGQPPASKPFSGMDSQAQTAPAQPSVKADNPVTCWNGYSSF